MLYRTLYTMSTEHYPHFSDKYSETQRQLPAQVPTQLMELGLKPFCLTAKSFLCCLNRFKARGYHYGME